MMQLDFTRVTRLLELALEEDIGGGDISSEVSVPPHATAIAKFVSRQEMVVCGLPVVVKIFEMLKLPGLPHTAVTLTPHAQDGAVLQKGEVIAELSGNARLILAGERLALNMLQRLSGIATQSRSYAEAVKGTKAVVLDTRKTSPGMRELEKYAVRVGGCTNHRMRLDDGVMLKDNHIAICGGISAALKAAQAKYPPEKIEIECDTLAQVEEALAGGAVHILLDNMDVPTLKQAIALVRGRAKLEASGGMILERIRGVAETGVDTISVGALTHAVPAVDIGLDMD